ncbi:MAG: NAD(P)H-dependent oxidoreductase [Deltaproteobacteria bacterium]|nr:NAD(P)H-dependent oxidoreductase [Deltaproteobacteria bacterium]
MFVLGLQGSPRKNGNTHYLLSAFMKEVQNMGVPAQTIDVCNENITACLGCGFCEKKGRCIITDDDMATEIYTLLRRADVIVVATPVFFFNMTSQLKALVDRCQTFWSAKYRLKVKDPLAKTRRGFLLSEGGSRGKNLFDGLVLTTRYFFDAIGAKYSGSLVYRGIDKKGDMQNHPDILMDVKKAAAKLVRPLTDRKRVLFACRENACRSQMAAAFAAHLAGDRIDAQCAGSEPADRINPDMVRVMAEKGIDMQFRKTGALEPMIAETSPQLLVTMGCGEQCPLVPGAEIMDWNLPDPAGRSLDFMRTVRDRIEESVRGLIQQG